MADSITYFAAVDGVTLGEKRFKLGKKIDADIVDSLHPTILNILEQSAQITTNPPVPALLNISDDKDPADMSREELEAAATKAIEEKMAQASDDDLRSAIVRAREEKAARDDNGATDQGGESDTGSGSTDYDALKDKPLYQLRTSELSIVAEHEGVSLEGISNNPDRVKAIDDARKAKAEQSGA